MTTKEKHDLILEKQVDRVFRNRSERMKYFTPRKLSKQRHLVLNIEKKKV